MLPYLNHFFMCSLSEKNCENRNRLNACCTLFSTRPSNLIKEISFTPPRPAWKRNLISLGGLFRLVSEINSFAKFMRTGNMRLVVAYLTSPTDRDFFRKKCDKREVLWQVTLESNLKGLNGKNICSLALRMLLWIRRHHLSLLIYVADNQRTLT